MSLLTQRLSGFEQDNAANPEPVEAEVRLDAGFGSYENLALVIEMGYEVYTKRHSHRVVAYLRQQVDDPTAWLRVGANAELVDFLADAFGVPRVERHDRARAGRPG